MHTENNISLNDCGFKTSLQGEQKVKTISIASFEEGGVAAPVTIKFVEEVYKMLAPIV
jgi:hypothetical protein